MTNRQWLAGLSDEIIANMMVKSDKCPPPIGGFIPPCANGDCFDCWCRWLRVECKEPTTAFYDIVEEHHNCMVQVLKNSVTGEMSVGWKKEQ